MQLPRLHPAIADTFLYHGAHGEHSSNWLCMNTVLHISLYRIADMVMICKANEGSEWPRYFLWNKNDGLPSARQSVQCKQCHRQARGWENHLILVHAGTLPHAHVTRISTAAATGTIEEVSRLAGEAACVTPAVRARRRTAQAHTPARVLVGALRTMSATPVSETEKKKKKNYLQPRPNRIRVQYWFAFRDKVSEWECDINQRRVTKGWVTLTTFVCFFYFSSQSKQRE